MGLETIQVAIEFLQAESVQEELIITLPGQNSLVDAFLAFLI